MCDQIMRRMQLDEPKTDEDWIVFKDDLVTLSEKMSINCINLHRNDVDCRHFCQTDPFSEKCKKCLSDPNTCNLMLRVDMMVNNGKDTPVDNKLLLRPCCGNIEQGFDCISCLRNASSPDEIRACTLSGKSNMAWWLYLIITCGTILVVILVIVTIVKSRQNMIRQQ